MNALIEARRNDMLNKIRSLRDEARELATQMRCSDQLRFGDLYALVDIGGVEMAEAHLNIGFLMLARALPFDK